MFLKYYKCLVVLLDLERTLILVLEVLGVNDLEDLVVNLVLGLGFLNVEELKVRPGEGQQLEKLLLLLRDL